MCCLFSGTRCRPWRAVVVFNMTLVGMCAAMGMSLLLSCYVGCLAPASALHIFVLMVVSLGCTSLGMCLVGSVQSQAVVNQTR